MLALKVPAYNEVDTMGSGNGQHRSRRHRQGHEKKDGVALVPQQSMQQVPKNTGQPKPHSAPKSMTGDTGPGAPSVTPPSTATPEKNVVPPAEEPPAVMEKPQPAPMMKTSRHTGQITPTPRGDLTDMLDTLRELFVRDRAIGSRPDATRCGICYLMFTQEEVTYREEEGFYICADCASALGSHRLPMLRRQKR